jgi:hypothetical protein
MREALLESLSSVDAVPNRQELGRRLFVALNAIEVDQRLPDVSPRRVAAGMVQKSSFGELAVVELSGWASVDAPSLRVLAGASSFPKGFRPTWPVVRYEVKWSGEGSEDAFADVSIYYGGIGIRGPVSTLRVFQERSEGYVDVTQRLEVGEQTITARLQEPGTLILVSAAPSPVPVR